tara:strand:+ start:1014 stop:1706 length:693 start_codon:yes stop_codon:yes gene_type:complete
MTFPQHVAIIMDGNGRWGLKKKKSRNYGHKKGLETVEKIIEAAIYKKIKYLTLFVFSTENWKRPVKEVNYLIRLLNKYIDKEISNLLKKNIKINVIGDISPFPNILKNKIKKISSLSKTNNKIQINMALNYGSRQEIIKAINSLNKNNLKINEKNINKFLYTHDVPEPEILIRTGNTKRISNFLIWQIIYSEIFFVKKMWPDFSKNDFYKIIENYKKIERKFGGLSERTK